MDDEWAYAPDAEGWGRPVRRLLESHTVTLLSVSDATYAEIARILHDAGHGHRVGYDGRLRLDGLALIAREMTR